MPVEPYPGLRDTNTSDPECTHGSEVAILVASGDSQTQRKGHAQDVAAPLLFLITALLVGVRPGQVPAPWFDEGWVVSVARNWVTLGHYGEVNGGTLVPTNTLNIGLPVVAAVAASIKLFGLGMTQARLPCMLYTLAAHVAMYVLVRKLWDERTALATWVLLLFATPLLPVWWGRQVLGEMPSAFFLVTGYLCLYLALGKRRCLAWAAGCLLALACVTKLQCLPFVVIGLCFGYIHAARLHVRYERTIIGTTVLASCLVTLLTVGLQSALLHYTLGGGDSTGVFGLTSIASGSISRPAAWVNLATYGVPTLIGLLCSVRNDFMKRDDRRGEITAKRTMRVILLATGLSWVSWFGGMSVGWPRYLVVPVFLAAPFLCDLLSRCTCGFRLRRALSLAAASFRPKGAGLPGLTALGALVLMSLLVGSSLQAIAKDYLRPQDSGLSQVVEFVNVYTPTDARIETYEMEIVAFVERTVSYPPASLTMSLIQSRFVSGAPLPPYDALASDPDYLVTGPESMLYPDLYGPVIAQGSFGFLSSYGAYTVYERAR